MNNLPGPLKETAERLGDLPGIGPKSALRIALTLLAWPEDKARGLGAAILELREKLVICSDCLSPADSDPCGVCADPRRDASVLCLVSDWDSLLAIEQAGAYTGLYMVLGLVSPIDNTGPDSLPLEVLRNRLAKGEFREILLGFGNTLDAETTVSYIKNLVESQYPNIQISRLAQGIPMGSDVKFMDKETLRQSLAYRQKV